MLVELLLDPQVWAAFLTLTALELVLGIDNVIFISILVDKLPVEKRELARRIGLFAAMFMRIALLMMLSWLVGLTEPIFSVMNQNFSGRDLLMLLGGLFLLWKSVGEIHEAMEGSHDRANRSTAHSFGVVILQIMLIDLVFSIDSIITAIGMVEQISVMVAAVVISIGLMMLFAKAIGEFVTAHPTIKILALAFLVVIGVVLIAEGLGHHIPKGYIYSAMTFAVIVEMLNLRIRKRSTRPVDLIASIALPNKEENKEENK
jgi:predicted tellurium resistance membrane protein TerC